MFTILNRELDISYRWAQLNVHKLNGDYFDDLYHAPYPFLCICRHDSARHDNGLDFCRDNLFHDYAIDLFLTSPFATIFLESALENGAYPYVTKNCRTIWLRFREVCLVVN